MRAERTDDVGAGFDLSGAKGVDMGRNIFQSTNPIAMCQAVGKVVHENYTDKQAYEFFLDISK